MKTVDYISKDRLKKFLERIEKLKGKTKLYIDGQKDVKFNSSTDVIVALYKYGDSNKTRFADDDSMQRSGYARSIGDLYRICSFYIPEVKIKEVIDSAQKACWQEEDEEFFFYLTHVYCGDVNKITYHNDGDDYMDDLPDKGYFNDDKVFREPYTYQLLSDLDL